MMKWVVLLDEWWIFAVDFIFDWIRNYKEVIKTKRELKPRDSIRPSCMNSSIRVSQLSTYIVHWARDQHLRKMAAIGEVLVRSYRQLHLKRTILVLNILYEHRNYVRVVFEWFVCTKWRMYCIGTAVLDFGIDWTQ